MAKNWHDYTAMTAALSSGADDMLVRDKSDLADNATEGTVRRLGWESLLAVSGITPGGRLTLESGVPVSTTDQTAKGTLYYTPYVHDYVRLYNGTRPTLYTFTERSLSLTLTSGKNYDVFLYDNSGTLTLELSAAWTNDTTRADALAWQAGVGWVKSGTATRLWLGTIRASGANTTEDSSAKRFVWNAYNRERRFMRVVDGTDSWTYASVTWRQSNNSAANQIEMVLGAEQQVTAIHTQYSTSGSTVSRYAGIGIDSASTPTAGVTFTSHGGSTAILLPSIARVNPSLSIGYHFLAALEACGTATTCTFYGDAGAPTIIQSGIEGSLSC